MEIVYKIKTALAKDIQKQLSSCDNNYIPSLSSRLSIEDYANKLYEKSMTFEAWENNNLVGLLCAYCNDYENHVAYISTFCVLDEYQGKGIAKKIMSMCLDYAKDNDFINVSLQVHKDNFKAINLYTSFGFVSTEDKGNTVIMVA